MPLYESIRRAVADGVIGDIVSLTTTENVTYHHMAMAYVRGKWGRVDKGVPLCSWPKAATTWTYCPG